MAIMITIASVENICRTASDKGSDDSSHRPAITTSSKTRRGRQDALPL